jgi:hypothetical protein
MEPVPGSPTIPAPSIFQSVEHPTATPEGTFDIGFLVVLLDWKNGTPCDT